MTTYRYPTVMSIAGFDGSGGAGIQADLKTISALGCYATSILTALPVQNTGGVRSVHPIPAAVVAGQLDAILEDIVPDAIKIGMVHTSELITTIAGKLRQYPGIPTVFDPVMISSSGHRLLDEEAIASLIKHLLPAVTILTPNLDEAALLAGMPVISVADMHTAGRRIRQMGCRSVLIKGGHLAGDAITTLFFDEHDAVHVFVSERCITRNTHGTGCTLSAAIAAYLARGWSFADAIRGAQTYIRQAICAGQDVVAGKGKGPLNHFFDPLKLIKIKLVEQ